jgi:hypothetical protein
MVVRIVRFSLVSLNMRHVLLILIYTGTFSKVSELSKEKKIEDAKNIAI